MRFWAVVAGSLASFFLILRGGGLWALVAASFITGPLLGAALYVAHRKFFSVFMRCASPARRIWLKRLWPMQWRLAILNLAGYAASNFLTLVLFQLHGPAPAGRFGMSWQIASTLNQLSMAPAQSRAPLFASYAATAQFDRLDQTWRKFSRRAVALMAGAAGLVSLIVVAIAAHEQTIAARLLPPFEFSLLLLGMVFTVGMQCQALYLRAFGKEPYHVVGIMAAVLAAGLALILGASYGALGVVSAYALATMLSFAWASVLFRRLRQEWRQGQG
jgi:hypothetical protein